MTNHVRANTRRAKCQRQASEFSSKSDFWTTNGSTSATNGKNPAADESYPPPAKPGLRLDGKPLDDNSERTDPAPLSYRDCIIFLSEMLFPRTARRRLTAAVRGPQQCTLATCMRWRR